jgi:hypothetical protein
MTFIYYPQGVSLTCNMAKSEPNFPDFREMRHQLVIGKPRHSVLEILVFFIQLLQIAAHYLFSNKLC